jgi:hypothetical protein
MISQYKAFTLLIFEYGINGYRYCFRLSASMNENIKKVTVAIYQAGNKLAISITATRLAGRTFADPKNCGETTCAGDYRLAKFIARFPKEF